MKALIEQQVMYNSELKDEELETEDEYMDIVLQFGLIVMFSSVFPLASALSCMKNGIRLYMLTKDNMNNRRTMPRISIGIGQFLYMIQVLCHISIVSNMSIVYFTSSTFRNLFIASPDEGYHQVCIGNTTMCVEASASTKMFMSSASFLAVVVVVEHSIELLQFVLAKYNENDDSFVKMERINCILMKQYMITQRFKDNINKRFDVLKKDDDDEKTKQEEKIRRKKNYLRHHYGNVKGIHHAVIKQIDGM